MKSKFASIHCVTALFGLGLIGPSPAVLNPPALTQAGMGGREPALLVSDRGITSHSGSGMVKPLYARFASRGITMA